MELGGEMGLALCGDQIWRMRGEGKGKMGTYKPGVFEAGFDFHGQCGGDLRVRGCGR